MPHPSTALPSRAAAPNRWAAVCRQLRTDAVVMERRCNALLAAPVASGAWLDAGVAFLREGLSRGCLRHLDMLGDMRTDQSGTASPLNAGVLASLWDASAASDAFLAHLRAAAARDGDLDRKVRAFYGESILAAPAAAATPKPTPDRRAPRADRAPACLPQLPFAFA